MVCNTVQEIKLGEAEVVLTGGAESMSQAPFTVRNMRFGTTLGQDLKVCVSFHNFSFQILRNANFTARKITLCILIKICMEI